MSALARLQLRFPRTDAAALQLVLDECAGDVDQSAAMIQQLLAHQQRPPRNALFRVVFSWHARSARELAVVRGDVVAAHDAAANDAPWMAVFAVQNQHRVETNANVASSLKYVPLACLRPLHADIGAVAMRDYVCAEDKVGHLSFRRDDRLILLSRIPGYDWWYALHRDGGPVGRVPITLLRVDDSNADVFAAEAKRTALPVMPTVEPPMVCDDDTMADALSDNDDDDDDDDDFDPLFYDVNFVRAEQLRRQMLLEAGDASVDEAARELIEWAREAPHDDELSTSSSSSSLSTSRDDSLWLNATQSAAVRSGLARMQ